MVVITKKKEGVLFPVMVVGGLSKESAPIAVMFAEREEGCHLPRGMIRAAESLQRGDAVVKVQVVQNMLGYAVLLRQHIYKEDNVLFPMADRVVSQEKRLKKRRLRPYHARENR